MEYENIKVLNREEFLSVLLKWQKECDEHFLPIAFLLEKFNPYYEEKDIRWFVDELFDDVESGQFGLFLKNKRKYGFYKSGNRIRSYEPPEDFLILLDKAVQKNKPGVFNYSEKSCSYAWENLYNPNKDITGHIVEFYIYNARFSPEDQGAMMILFDLENCVEPLFNVVADEPLFIKGKDGKVYAFVTSISC